MHEPVKSSLEEYLRDDVSSCTAVETHLRGCESCRVEIQAMREQAVSLRSFRPPREMEPDPGFYARVIGRIERESRPSVWSLFGDSLFARRLVYASAGFIVLLGTAMMTLNPEPQTAARISGSEATPEVILAGDQALPQINVDPGERGVVLVSLATYQDFQ